MKNIYNRKKSRKLKIVSLSVGIASVTTAIAVVTPLAIQKNISTSTSNNSFSSKMLPTFTNNSFVQQSVVNSSSQLTNPTLSDYTFPLLSSTNQTNITGSNLQNLYNINGNSILYAQSKGASNIDSIVSINQVNNNMNWAISSASLIDAINSYANSNSGQSVNTIFGFNKMVYSAASGNLFLNLYVGNSGSESSGYTTIVEIANIGSNSPTITDYFNSSISDNSSVLGSLKNSNFSQFGIEADASSNPVLYLVKDKYTSADQTTSTSGVIQYNLVSFAVRFSSTTHKVGIAAGIIIKTPLNFSTSDINFLTSNSSNAFYVTNSSWLSGGSAGGLMIILCRNVVSNLNDFATIYSFAATGATFLNAPSSQILSLNLSQFISNQPVILNFEQQTQTQTSNFTLIGSQKNSNATTSSFNSNGSIAAFKLSININGNNAPISLQTFSNNNLAYGNGQQILGIVNVNNTSNLPSGAQYIALTSSGALVILNSNFNYLNELATISSTFFPAGVNVLNIIANGLNYLVYLSNGSIIVFNNTGYLGYLSSITTNNTIQTITPISFKPQNSIASGVAIFTQPLNQFVSSVTSQGNQLIFSLINTTNTSLNYLVQTSTITNDNSTDPFSAQVTLNVYQQLLQVNAVGTPISSTVVSTVFLGSHTYNIYNKAGGITANLITSLPESLQNILPSQITVDEVQQYLLAITNIDQSDIFTNGSNNIGISLSPQNTEGSLVVNVIIGSYWATTSSGAVQQQNTSLSFKISGFVTGPSADQLDYTLNPISPPALSSKYSDISPDALTSKDVLIDFIKLSTYLAGLQGTTINIIPNPETGTATITITFNFPNSFYTLAQNSAASLVTQNSITWTTPAVFASNPSINNSILFNFNSSQYIKVNNAATINNLPSTIESIINGMTSLSEKVQWLIDKGFINVSNFVRDDISAVFVITQTSSGNSSDLTGTFILAIQLTNALPNTLSKSYSYNYSGFLRSKASVSSAFSVTNFSYDTYMAMFQSDTNFKSIFSVEPSLVSEQNLISWPNNDQNNTNSLSGYLIKLSDLTASAQYTVDLTPDNINGSLLITIVFSNYVEINAATGDAQTIQNKRFVFIYTGFKKSSAVQIFSLNWKSSQELTTLDGKTNLLTLSASDAIKSIPSGTSAIDQLQMFAELSKTAVALYQNNQLINIKYTTDDSTGTIIVNVSFVNWNNVTSAQTFTQTFSGFLISNETSQIEASNPFVTNSSQILENLKKIVPSNVSKSQWLSLFSFSTTVLNSLQKIIYVLYNDETGYVSFVLLAKPLKTSSQNNNIPTIVLQQSTLDSTTTKPDVTSDSSGNGISFSDIPFSNLKSEGYVEINPKVVSQQLFSGFKQQKTTYTAPNNVLSIILALVIPSVVFIPLILVLLVSKNKKAIKNVKTKITKRLEEEYAKEKDLDEDEE